MTNGGCLARAICDRLARFMHGKIRVQRGQEGQGACFVVVLREAVVISPGMAIKSEMSDAKEKGEIAHA